MLTVEIRPPSVRAETLNVLKTAAAIVVLVAAYLFRPPLFDNAGERTVSRPADLLPFQSLVRDAPGADQRMFRELQEGLLEAERIRAVTGRWPEAMALASDGIPPFAADPTRKGASYRWSTLGAGQHGELRGHSQPAFGHSLAPGYPRARSRRAARPCTQRRNPPSAAGRHHAARVHLAGAGEHPPKRILGGGDAAE
jgi:hypothetical protein